MNQEREIPRITGIADPKCRCTVDTVCQLCQQKTRGAKLSWADAVLENNEEVKGIRVK